MNCVYVYTVVVFQTVVLCLLTHRVVYTFAPVLLQNLATNSVSEAKDDHLADCIVGRRDFSFRSKRPDWLYGPHSLLFQWVPPFFHGLKAVGAWC